MTKKKNDAVRQYSDLFLVRPGGFEPLAFRVGELRQGSIDRRYTVNFVGSAQ